MKFYNILHKIKYLIGFYVFIHAFNVLSMDTSSFIPPVNFENQQSQDTRADLLIQHVETSIYEANRYSSKLSKKALQIHGMSSAKVRHLLNNLCSFPGANYLEIGVWKGSTWISALLGNKTTISSAIAIDNWSEFHGPMKEFAFNCAHFLPNFPFRFYSADSFSTDIQSIFERPVNIYFYDGNHTELSQELAFTYYDSILDDVFIAIVDDWNLNSVQAGTLAAFKKLGYNVLHQRILPADYNGDIKNWWNGLYVAVIQKNQK